MAKSPKFKICGKKTTRLMWQLHYFLKNNGIAGELHTKYDRKKGRDTFSTGRDFMVSEQMVDFLISICNDLKLDLATSGIKASGTADSWDIGAFSAGPNGEPYYERTDMTLSPATPTKP